MSAPKVFVSREKDLEVIARLVHDWGTLRVISINGERGIGKTSLLRETQRLYKDRDDLLVVYIDCDETQSHNIIYIGRQIVKQLGPEHFEEYSQHINKVQVLPTYDLGKRIERELFLAILKDIRRLAQEKRVILLIDTFEVIQGTEIGKMIYSTFIPTLPNALVVIAGRRNKEIRDELTRVYGEWVEFITLTSFELEASKRCFEALELTREIPTDLQEKIHFLTNGRPVLISLAIEWLSHDIPLPQIVDTTLVDLQGLKEDALDSLREDFEFELVNQARALERSIDQAILYMAHINRRYNAEILALLMDIDLEAARAIIDNLAELSFIRFNPLSRNCMLHDEMRYLVLKHAWPYVDALGEIRKTLSQRIVNDYYEPKIAELEDLDKKRKAVAATIPVNHVMISNLEWEKWLLEAECLHYRLGLDLADGRAYFSRLFEEALRSNQATRSRLLIGELEVQEREDLVDEVNIKLARTLWHEGRSRDARHICEQLLKADKLDKTIRLETLSTLGSLVETPGEKIKYFKQALQISKSLGDDRLIGIMHNSLGLTYRQQGEWDIAIEHYQHALTFSEKVENETQVAATMNNLAYVYMLKGNLSQADALCRVALSKREALGTELDLAWSYQTMGRIDQEQNDLTSASQNFQKALVLFDKLQHKVGLVGIYAALANISQCLGNHNDATNYLRQGLLLTEEKREQIHTPQTLNAYGDLLRIQGQHLIATMQIEKSDVKFSLAEKYLQESIQLSRRYANWRLVAKNLVDLAWLNHARARFRQQDWDCLDEAQKIAEGRGFTFLRAEIEELRGEVKYRKRAYKEAFEHYALAILILAGYVPTAYQRAYDKFSERLLDPRVSVEQVNEACEMVLTLVEKSKDKQQLSSLVELAKITRHYRIQPDLSVKGVEGDL